MQEEYLKKRLQVQIDYFEKKSPIMKRHYYVFAFLAAVGSILTPVLLNVCEKNCLGTIISIVVAISIAANELFKFKDKWLLYRSSAEYLNSLLYSYKAESALDNFDENAEFEKLKDCVESFLKNSNNEWRGLVKAKKANDDGNK